MRVDSTAMDLICVSVGVTLIDMKGHKGVHCSPEIALKQCGSKRFIQQVIGTDHIITSMVAKNAYSCLVMIGVGHRRPISLKKKKKKKRRRKVKFTLFNDHHRSLLRRQPEP